MQRSLSDFRYQIFQLRSSWSAAAKDWKKTYLSRMFLEDLMLKAESFVFAGLRVFGYKIE